MFKVAIIDDETLVRVGLKSLIAWGELGYEIVGEGDNGQNGLELIINGKPDIVITDIKMPIMGGLEMMKKVLDTNKNTKFIVLSSYNEFDLVKQAMKLGAEDYLLKLEMNSEVLKDVLAQVSSKILDEAGRNDEINSIENQIRVNKAVIREEFFRNIIGKMVPNRRFIDESIKPLEIDLHEQNLSCFLVKVNLSNISHKYNDEDLKLLDFMVINIIEEICNEFFKSYAFKWNHGVYVGAFSKCDDLDIYLFKEKTDDMCEILIQMLKQYVNIDVSIGISKLHSGYENLGKAFSEASEAVENTFFKGYGSIIYFSSLSQRSSKQFDIKLHQYKNELLKAIEVLNVETIHQICSDICMVFEENKLSKENAYELCCQLAYFIDASLSHDWALSKEKAGFGRNIFESIKSLETISEIKKWIRDFEIAVCSFLIQNKQDEKHYLIAKAKKYIIENYSDNISLRKVAELLNVSPGYLSNLFTQYTSMSFIDYVTMTKISMAKKFLKETNYKIYEISYMLGYENATYFSKIFKKTTGVTPKEYIQSCQEH